MSTRYLPILDEIQARLEAINPQRLVTRNWADFANRPEDVMRQGVWIIRFDGIASYPYEVSDGGFATDSLRPTEHGRMRIVVIGQILLPMNADGSNPSGEQIDAAEFDLIHELEQLADDAIETDLLIALKLESVITSQQAESPYAWVFSTWETLPLN